MNRKLNLEPLIIWSRISAGSTLMINVMRGSKDDFQITQALAFKLNECVHNCIFFFTLYHQSQSDFDTEGPTWST